MTKTQEFLEKLKDPEAYVLGKGVRAFLDDYNHKIWNVSFWEADPKPSYRVWLVEMTADDRDVLSAYVSVLSDYILEHAPHGSSVVPQAYTIEDTCGLHTQSFEVVF